MASKSREDRAIKAVPCPVCRVKRGEPCEFNDDERSKLPRGRLKALLIHGSRRKLYQDVRDAEMSDDYGIREE